MIQQIAAPTALQLLVPHLLCFSIQNEGNITKQPDEWMEEIARMHNQQQFKKQQDAMARLQSEITHNKDSNQDLIDVNRRLEEQIRDAEANNQQLELQMQQRNGNISNVIDELRKEIKDLEGTLNKDQVGLIDEIDKLKEENRQCQSNVEEGSLELNDLRNQVNNVQYNLESTRRNSDNITRYLKAKDTELEDLQKQVEDLQRQLDIIPLLKRMRPSEKNKELMKIVEEGNVTVLPILLQMGVNISTKDGFGSTSLHRAARRGRYEVAKILINAGADIEEKDVYGNTPLIWASWHGHLDVCKLLLDRGAQPNARSDHGSTALHYAAFYGHLEIAMLLVERGAQANVMDKWGRTPREDAISNRHWPVVEFLRTHS